MGDYMIRFFPYVPYVSIIGISFGFFLMVLGRHDFFIVLSDQVRQLPARLRHQLQAYTQDQIQKNPLIKSDQTRLIRDLELTKLRWRKKPLTIPHVVILSLMSATLMAILVILLTTRYIKDPSTLVLTVQSTPKEALKHWVFNIPADILAFGLGFIIPRWYIFLGSVKARYKYQEEAPKAFFKIASAIRRHANLEVAISSSVQSLPAYTRWLFILALDHWKQRDFTSFSEVFYWVAKQTQHESWEEFASYTSTASSAGLNDLVSKISLLTTRAQELLGKRKEEKKGLKFQIGLSSVAFVLLMSQVFSLIYKNPDMGQYLFITPWGKILFASIFIAVFAEVSIFTWLHYQV